MSESSSSSSSSDSEGHALAQPSPTPRAFAFPAQVHQQLLDGGPTPRAFAFPSAVHGAFSQSQQQGQGQGQGQPERIIIDVNQFPDEFVLVTGPPATGVSEPPVVAPFEFNLEAAVNNMVELAAQTAQAEVLGEANAEAPGEDGAGGAEDDEDDDDEDMEMVDVDSYMRQEGLQT